MLYFDSVYISTNGKIFFFVHIHPGDHECTAFGSQTTIAKPLGPQPLNGVQIDAAMALQRSGEESGETPKLVQAIMGGGVVKDPKTKKDKKVIWGWGKLSQAIANRPQFKQQFLVARYNLAKSRLLYHKIKPNSKLMDLALKDIDVARKKYPDLGGPKMKAEFDQLVKDIQAAK